MRGNTIATRFHSGLRAFGANRRLVTTVHEITTTNICRVLRIRHITIFIRRFVEARGLRQLATLLAFVRRNFVTSVKEYFFTSRTSDARLLFPPFTARLPWFPVPPINTRRAHRQAQGRFVKRKFATISFPARLLGHE